MTKVLPIMHSTGYGEAGSALRLSASQQVGKEDVYFGVQQSVIGGNLRSSMPRKKV
jgi:hypothetical protein